MPTLPETTLGIKVRRKDRVSKKTRGSGTRPGVLYFGDFVKILKLPYLPWAYQKFGKFQKIAKQQNKHAILYTYIHL